MATLPEDKPKRFKKRILVDLVELTKEQFISAFFPDVKTSEIGDVEVCSFIADKTTRTDPLELFYRVTEDELFPMPKNNERLVVVIRRSEKLDNK